MLKKVGRWSLLLALGLLGFFYEFSLELPVASFPQASEAQSLATVKPEALAMNSEYKALEKIAEASRANLSAEEKPEDKSSELPKAEADKLLTSCALANFSACPLASLVVPGELVNLQPTGSIVVPLTGTIQFIATLINPHSKAWNVIGELLVKKADGTTLTLLAPRQIHLSRGQTLTLPVGLSADPSTFSPGLNEFIAILRDLQGNLIDQASVTFILTLDLKK